MVDRVDDARDGQEKAQEQFANALEEFSALIGFDGGNLEALYSRLDIALSKRCEPEFEAAYLYVLDRMP